MVDGAFVLNKTYPYDGAFRMVDVGEYVLPDTYVSDNLGKFLCRRFWSGWRNPAIADTPDDWTHTDVLLRYDHTASSACGGEDFGVADAYCTASFIPEKDQKVRLTWGFNGGVHDARSDPYTDLCDIRVKLGSLLDETLTQVEDAGAPDCTMNELSDSAVVDVVGGTAYGLFVWMGHWDGHDGNAAGYHQLIIEWDYIEEE